MMRISLGTVALATSAWLFSSPLALAQLPVGFSVADADENNRVDQQELHDYLSERLNDGNLPHRAVFKRLDSDSSGWVSEAEFEKRHEVLEDYLGDDFVLGLGGNAPLDPGPGFVPFRQLTDPLDDAAIFGALFHRYAELNQEASSWCAKALNEVESQVDEERPQEITSHNPRSLKSLYLGTVMLAGGGDQFFTAGGVVITRDGLALTNYHVAEAIGSGNVMAMTSEGGCHRVVDFLAGSREADVALIRLEGEDFETVRLASQPPLPGESLVMVHHSENRFYTLDRGHVSRYSRIQGVPRLEISANYAPGGSGCGIYNQAHELVGLVSSIALGDGPGLATGQWGSDSPDSEEMAPTFSPLVVKHAVPLSAIQDLWSASGSD